MRPALRDPTCTMDPVTSALSVITKYVDSTQNRRPPNSATAPTMKRIGTMSNSRRRLVDGGGKFDAAGSDGAGRAADATVWPLVATGSAIVCPSAPAG